MFTVSVQSTEYCPVVVLSELYLNCTVLKMGVQLQLVVHGARVDWQGFLSGSGIQAHRYALIPLRNVEGGKRGSGADTW